MDIAWIWLFCAAVCEVAWAIGLKYSAGFSRLVPSVFTVALMLLSFVLLAQAMKRIPVGTAYAVWTGIGAVGTAVLGILLFDEPRHIGRVASLVLVVLGIIGLKFFSPSAPQ